LIRLYWLFLQGSLKGIVGGLAMGIFIITIIERVGAPPLRGLGLAIALLMYGFLFFNLFQLPRNLSWALLLPVSRRKLVLTHVMLTFSNGVLVGGCSILLGLYALETSEFMTYFQKMFGAAGARPEGLPMGAIEKTLEPPHTSGTLMPWVYLSVAIVSVVSYLINSLAFAAGITNQRKQIEIWDSRRTLRSLGMFSIIAIIALLFRPFLDNGFVYYVIALSAVAIIATRHTTIVLGLPKLEKRRWIGASAATVAILAMITFVQARTVIQNQDPKELVEAVEFMGPWGGAVNPYALSRILLQPLTPYEFRNARELLDDSLPGEGLKLHPNGTELVSFIEVAQAQQDHKTLKRVPEIFRVNDMSLADLEAYLDHQLALVPDRYLVRQTLEPVLQVPLREREVVQLQQRQDRLTRQFLLMRERIYQEGWTLSWMIREMKTWSVAEREQAWKTLWVLTGTPTDGWTAAESGLLQLRIPASMSAKRSCKGLSIESEQLYACLWRNYYRLDQDARNYLELTPGFFQAPFDRLRKKEIKRMIRMTTR
jgi:hypothetical protein